MHLPRSLTLLAVIFACTFSGCGDTHKKKLVGTWEIAQIAEVADRVGQNDNGRELQSDKATGQSKMTITFGSGGDLETQTLMGAMNRKKNGTWKMTSYDTEASAMEISCEINTQTSEHEISFVDENTIELVPPNMAGLTMKLKFKRQ